MLEYTVAGKLCYYFAGALFGKALSKSGFPKL